MKKPPSHWRRLSDVIWPPESDHHAATAWEHKLVPLRVLCSMATVKDGSEWIHLSVSRPDRLPTWPELVKIRDEFLGDGVEVYQVIPVKADYVNIHQFCLHLWAPEDGRRCVANLQDLVNEEAL